MNCLVTGATGFIGNAITKRLAKEGNVVYALIHNKKPEKYEKNVEYIKCDLTKPSTLKKLPKKIDIVIHCAAIVKDYGPKDLFYNVNVEGTKNLVNACKKYKLKRFLFISHMGYELEKKYSYYNITKKIAEKYLNEKYQNDGFPVVIIIPGNVYGPGATTWVLRPLESIKTNKIALINNGQGIFLHTYIDNLIDALITAINEPKAIGQTINVTDGDHSITWGKYLNDLAKIMGKKPINKNFSKKTGMIIAKTMMYLYKIFNFQPWVTPLVVSIFSNDKTVSIKKAEKILNYKPKINYEKGMKEVEEWIKHKRLSF
ncbi:MAG: NAD(P)-dependent oxidoreductase [Thermoplasmatales archaeon]|nr:MAG: NAD(P)-dependent oxidoreductase [Thermoplasmatales archaeon]